LSYTLASSFDIGTANVLEKLRAGVACTVPAFLGDAFLALPLGSDRGL
jgi:hypothetical protein